MKVKGLLFGIAVGLAAGSLGTLILSPGSMPAVNAGADREVCCNGDTNGDGNLDISDAVYLLSHLFAGGPAPVPGGGGEPCADFGGRWSVLVGADHYNTCELPGPAMPFSMIVRQSDCAITVISGVDENVQFEGTVCGRLARWSGKTEYEGGTLTMDSVMSMDDENTVGGTTGWKLQNPRGEVVCAGVDFWSARR